MHRALVFSLLLLATSLSAGSAYHVQLGARLENGSLKVAPTASGPAGKVLAYEMTVRRESGSGTASSHQSGTVALGRDGTAPLASSSVSVGPSDRYRISVRLLDQGHVVAEDSASFPQ